MRVCTCYAISCISLPPALVFPPLFPPALRQLGDTKPFSYLAKIPIFQHFCHRFSKHVSDRFHVFSWQFPNCPSFFLANSRIHHCSWPISSSFHHFSVVLHHFSRLSPGYMTFTQLFAGGERLGYFASYGQRPLARTAALSGGAIDGFIMANYDSMSSPKMAPLRSLDG